MMVTPEKIWTHTEGIYLDRSAKSVLRRKASTTHAQYTSHTDMHVIKVKVIKLEQKVDAESQCRAGHYQ